MLWEFIELPPFAELRDSLFSDDDLLSLQEYLCEHPEAGDVIPATSGCRKLRWSAKGKGKRGGARVIYFLRTRAGQIILVAVYGKGERDDVPRPWLKRIKETFEHEQG
jgi:mRNA-degrading endonuclease RelE of RelBE toxin-antitoxin system